MFVAVLGPVREWEILLFSRAGCRCFFSWARGQRAGLLSCTISCSGGVCMLGSFEIFAMLITAQLSILGDRRRVPGTTSRQCRDSGRPPSTFTSVIRAACAGDGRERGRDRVVGACGCTGHARGDIGGAYSGDGGDRRRSGRPMFASSDSAIRVFPLLWGVGMLFRLSGLLVIGGY